MKDDQPKTKRPPLIGKDELNLCECPLTLLTDSAEEGQKTLEFTDKQNDIIRHWTITGSDESGLPCALDEPVFIAMLYLTKRDGINSRKIYFSTYEMLRIMKWSINGKYYDRLELALKRLHGVSIYTDYLWDRGKFKKQIKTIGFHILEEFDIDKGIKNTKNSWFKWGDKLFESFLNGNLKNLNLDIYFDLKTPTSKRFYRLCDKRLYKNEQISFDLQELCHEKLGISQNIIYPSEMRRKLEPILKEHKAKTVLSYAGFTKNKKTGRWILTIKKHKEEPVQIQPSAEETLPAVEEPETSICSLINQMVSIGVARKVAENLVNTVSTEVIENQIEALPYRNRNNTIENKAAFLIKSILEAFPLPDALKKKLAGRECERQNKLKEEYNCFIIDQVDVHLQKCDKAEIEREIEEFKPLFMDHWGLDDIAMQNPYWRPILEEYYKFHRKAKTLDIPSFEEWKANYQKVGVQQ